MMILLGEKWENKIYIDIKKEMIIENLCQEDILEEDLVQEEKVKEWEEKEEIEEEIHILENQILVIHIEMK